MKILPQIAKVQSYKMKPTPFHKVFPFLTMEHSQVLRSIRLHILPICRAYYGKKTAKRNCALVASFKSYDYFTGLRSISMCSPKKSNYETSTLNFAHR
jgi:hypothetical protein